MKLKQNANIGVCAPADAVDIEKYFAAEKYFKKKYNLNLLPSKNIFKHYGCFAGTDAQRADDINNFFNDNRIAAIIFARGGYGSAALLDKLNFFSLLKNPKLIMGFSDVTSILLSIYSIIGITTFYGPMITSDFSEPLTKLTKKSFENMILDTGAKNIIFTETETAKFNIIKSDTKLVSGKIIAGCLTIFNTLIGTPYLKIPDDTILFLEDTGEEVYRIDRALTHIKNSGIIKKCKALILDFANYKSSLKNKKTIPLHKRLLDIFYDIDISIMFWNCFGHRKKKIILPIGQTVKFNFDAKTCEIDINY